MITLQHLAKTALLSVAILGTYVHAEGNPPTSLSTPVIVCGDTNDINDTLCAQYLATGAGKNAVIEEGEPKHCICAQYLAAGTGKNAVIEAGDPKNCICSQYLVPGAGKDAVIEAEDPENCICVQPLAAGAGENAVVEPGDPKNCVDLSHFDRYPDYTVVWTTRHAPTPQEQIVVEKFTNYTISHKDEMIKNGAHGQLRKSYHLEMENHSLPFSHMEAVYTLETDDYMLKTYNGLSMPAVTQNIRHISNHIVKVNGKVTPQPNGPITTRYVPYRLMPVKRCLGAVLKQTYTEDNGKDGSLVHYYGKVTAIGEKVCVKAGCFNTIREHEIFKNNSGVSDTQGWIDIKTGVLVRVEGNAADAELTYIDK